MPPFFRFDRKRYEKENPRLKNPKIETPKGFDGTPFHEILSAFHFSETAFGFLAFEDFEKQGFVFLNYCGYLLMRSRVTFVLMANKCIGMEKFIGFSYLCGIQSFVV